jgi:hypothetical protein
MAIRKVGVVERGPGCGKVRSARKMARQFVRTIMAIKAVAKPITVADFTTKWPPTVRAFGNLSSGDHSHPNTRNTGIED